jgi:nitrile hydratase accessory protein
MSANQGHALAAIDRELGAETPLPRDNGELVFEEPWHGRALGMGVVALDRAGAPWSEFRRYLATAIARHPARDGESGATTYYAAWLDALEVLLADRGLLDHAGDASAPASVRRRTNNGASDRQS